MTSDRESNTELAGALLGLQRGLLFESQRSLVARAAAALTEVSGPVREAFRAGWYVNAAVDDQPSEYLEACEEVDWCDYLRADAVTRRAT